MDFLVDLKYYAISLSKYVRSMVYEQVGDIERLEERCSDNIPGRSKITESLAAAANKFGNQSSQQQLIGKVYRWDC